MKKDLENKIRIVLKNEEATRNDDILLMKRIWESYYPHLLFEVDGVVCVSFPALDKLPREDHIKRIRAKIQNVEKQYVPTDVKIAVKRGWSETDWHSWALDQRQLSLLDGQTSDPDEAHDRGKEQGEKT